MTDMERLESMLRWCGDLAAMRFYSIESLDPGAAQHEIYARWTEATYRGRVPDQLLDATLAEIRRRGEQRLPPYDRD